METVILFDAGLVALESTCISPGEGIHHSTLRCHTLPSGEKLLKAATSSMVLRQIVLMPVQCRIFFLSKGCDWNFRLSL